MDPSTVFALHFARLLSQLVHDPSNIGAHRQATDDLLAANESAVTLVWDDWKLLADGTAIPQSMPGVRDVVARMAAHGIRKIVFGPATEPGHVLGAVWILAREPKLGDGGQAAVDRLAKLGVSRVRFIPIEGGEEAGGDVPRPMMPTPSSGLPEVLLEELDDLELSMIGMRPTPEPMSVVPEHRPSADRGPDTPEGMLDRLRNATMLGDVTRMLDSLSTVITGALSAERHGDAAQLVSGIIATESTFASDPDARRAFTLALKRLADWGLIRELANGFAKAGERRPQYLAVFSRYGDDAVDELLGRLVYAESVRERRILFDAIVQLGSGVRTMIQMLDDPRWYVVRNSADLLGRIGALAAEGPLVRALRHDEARVRRSAALALARLGTPAAFSALRDALTDPAPGVRMHAVLALATRKDASSAAALTKVLDVETDPEVQQTIFTALGKIGTPGAVRRLIEAATNEGKMFRRTPIPFRVAALRALADVQTPEAIATLQSLTSDKEREVRENAAKAIASRSSGATPAQPSGPATEW